MVKAAELRTQSKEELESQLASLKADLAKVRTQATNGKPIRVGVLRKDIARVLTVITSKQRESLREFYAGKKVVPKDLRAKQTRAIRRRLTPAQANKKTAKAAKRASAFPAVKYAIKA